ncbi:MAG: hypothetical protein ACE5RP_00170 [Nitrosopumilus sp.]
MNKKKKRIVVIGIGVLVLAVFTLLILNGVFSVYSSPYVKKTLTAYQQDTYKSYGEKSDIVSHTIPACSFVNVARVDMQVISRNTRDAVCRNAEATAESQGKRIRVNCAGDNVEERDSEIFTIFSSRTITGDYTITGTATIDVGGRTSNSYDEAISQVEIYVDYIIDSDCDGILDDVDECLNEKGIIEENGCPAHAPEPECTMNSQCDDREGYTKACINENCIYELQPEPEEPDSTLIENQLVFWILIVLGVTTVIVVFVVRSRRK